VLGIWCSSRFSCHFGNRIIDGMFTEPRLIEEFNYGPERIEGAWVYFMTYGGVWVMARTVGEVLIERVKLGRLSESVEEAGMHLPPDLL